MQGNNIENWIYFLRGLVRIATIGRKNNFRDTKEAKICFEYQLNNGRVFWELFKKEFREKKLSLNDIEKQNLYDDLKTEFYPYIDKYIKWLSENKSLEKLEYYFIYQTFFEFCNDTKKEIERLKPEKSRPIDNLSRYEFFGNYLLKNLEVTKVHLEMFNEASRLEAKQQYHDKMRWLIVPQSIQKLVNGMGLANAEELF